MSNDLFRRRTISAIQQAIREAHDASLHDHHGVRGRIREIVVERLIRPLLPMSFAVGSGTIVDAAGKSSAETDVVIYSRELLPPILYSERDGVFPVEATLFAIEVKSRLSASELQDAVQKARRINSLTYMSGYYDDRGNPELHLVRKIQPFLFAFSSDLTRGGKTELQRYREVDPVDDAAIPNICVVGNGCWLQEDTGGWLHQSGTEDHQEVVFALATIINSLHRILSSRGQPRLGWYLLPPGSRSQLRVPSGA